MKLVGALVRSMPLALGILLFGAPVRASGYAVARFGGETGHPVTDNATAVYFNPAALTRSGGTHVFLDGTVALRIATYTHQPAPSDIPEPAGAEGGNSGKAELLNLLVSPFVGVTHQLGDLTLGAAIYVPFGGRAKFDKVDRFAGNAAFPGLVDGPQRWFLTEGEILSTYFTAAAAYHIGALSLGVSASAIQSRVSLTRARVSAGTDDIAIEGRSFVDVSGWQYGFAAGAMYEAIPKALWVGASYTSKPNPFSDEMKLSGELSNFFPPAARPSTVDLDFYQNLPDTYRLGAAYRAFDDIEFQLSGEIMRWSKFQRQCLTARDKACDVDARGASSSGNVYLNLPREWKDSYGVRAGASYWLVPSAELDGSIGYTSSAVPKSQLEPSLPDFDELRVAIGTRIALTERLRIGASYAHSFWFSVDNAGQSSLANYASPTKQPDAGGKYTQTVGALNANIDFVF